MSLVTPRERLRDGLALVISETAPGGRLVNLRKLLGGWANAVHAADVIEPDGVRRRLIVRRRLEGAPALGAADFRREWGVLTALQHTDIPAPRPVWLDAEGAVFGTPTMIVTRLPGRVVLTAPALSLQTAELGRTLAGLHDRVVVDRELEALPRLDVEALHALDGVPVRERLAHPFGPALWSALQRLRLGLSMEQPVLLHGDYGPVNVLWARRRLTGVVDWESAGRGVRAYDVAHCRVDLALLCGIEVADRFLRAYQEFAARPLVDLAFWDLHRAWRALPNPERWLAGVYDLGYRDVTASMARARLDAFIQARLPKANDLTPSP